MVDLLRTVKFLARDCATAGRGPKRWWARRLGVPPLTISHWLAGRQAPSGPKVEAILCYFQEQERAAFGRDCIRLLWGHYYAGDRMPTDDLRVLALGALRSPTIDVRTLALLVYLGKMVAELGFETPVNPDLANRLGWLLEKCGKTPPYDPIPTLTPRPFIRASEGADSVAAILPYLRQQRTPLGRRWHLWDASIDDLVYRLAWKQRTRI